MEKYELRLPKTVFSGVNALNKIGDIVKGTYKKAAIFTDKGIEKAGLLEEPLKIIKSKSLEVEILNSIPSEPGCDEAQLIIERFYKTGADLIVAVGGGSVMDVAKLASVIDVNKYNVRDIIDNQELGKKRIPTLMIPTTAGTGSEATMNSIVAIPEKMMKVGIVNPEMIPDYVILDGSMIKHLPKKIAASTGIDALCHAIECYTSLKANPFSNLFALESTRLIIKNIEKACTDEEALEEKTNMLLAAFYAGVAITSSGTTAVHALSYPLGGKYHIPHGISNAMLLLPVLKYNRSMCEMDYAKLYDAINGEKEPGHVKEKADCFLMQIEEIIRSLEIPNSLREYGVDEASLHDIIEAAMDVKRLLNNNKRNLTYEDAKKIYMEIM